MPITEKIWNSFYEGVISQQPHRVATNRRPPTTAETMPLPTLIGRYEGEGHEGETLLHATISGNLGWRDKEDLVENILARLDKSLPPSEVAAFLSTESTATGDTALHSLYQARQATPQKADIIDRIIEKMIEKAPDLPHKPNHQGKVPADTIPVSAATMEGLLKTAGEKVARI